MRARPFGDGLVRMPVGIRLQAGLLGRQRRGTIRLSSSHTAAPATAPPIPAKGSTSRPNTRPKTTAKARAGTMRFAFIRSQPPRRRAAPPRPLVTAERRSYAHRRHPVPRGRRRRCQRGRDRRAGYGGRGCARFGAFSVKAGASASVWLLVGASPARRHTRGPAPNLGRSPRARLRPHQRAEAGILWPGVQHADPASRCPSRRRCGGHLGRSLLRRPVAAGHRSGRGGTAALGRLVHEPDSAVRAAVGRGLVHRRHVSCRGLGPAGQR